MFVGYGQSFEICSDQMYPGTGMEGLQIDLQMNCNLSKAQDVSSNNQSFVYTQLMQIYTGLYFYDISYLFQQEKINRL